MYAEILKTIKDITGARFYFITSLLFVLIAAVLFKDEIKQFNFNPKELRECSNQEGLVTKLKSIESKYDSVKGYVFYLYQPNVDSYYKRLVVSDLAYINNNDFFKAMPLNSQKYLNYLLIEKEYVFVSADESKKEAEIAIQYDAEYVYIYNVFLKETVGEIILTFKHKPTQQELDAITKDLRNVKYYVI